MLKSIIVKFKARKLETRLHEMKMQQETEYAAYALKLRVERMLAQPASPEIAA
jgi:hypothetical protein